MPMATPRDRTPGSPQHPTVARPSPAIATASALALALGAGACTPEGPAQHEAGAVAPPVTHDASGAHDAGPAADAQTARRITAPATVVHAGEIPRRAPRELHGAPYASRAATVGRTLVEPGGAWKTWSLTWTPPLTARVILQHTARAGEPSDYAVVLDVDHGTRSAQFHHPVDVSERAGAVAVMAGSPPTPALLRLADGQIHIPGLRDIHRGVVRLEALMVRPESQDIVVVGQTPDGERLAGLWTNPEAGGVVLTNPLSFAPRFVYGDEATHSVDLFDGSGVPAGLEAPGAACARLRLARGTRPECRAFEPSEDRAADLWFGSDWVWRHDEGLINARDRSRAPLPEPAAQCAPVKALNQPPRLLISCRAPGASDKGYYLFADGGGWVGWREAPDAHRDVARDATREPVLPLDHEVDGPADLVVDLEGRALIETGGLRPLHAPSRAARMLATRETPGPRPARELVLLDAHAGTTEVIARYGDCPGELVEVARAAGRVAIECQRQPDPAAFRFVHVWSEVLDLDRRIRWRTPYAVESVLADGRALVSDRRETAAQGEAWFTRLFVLNTP